MFIGLLPLFDPPRHDSAETIRRALNLGFNVMMIIVDQLAISKEPGHGLGMGTNMYPSSSPLGQNLLGQYKDYLSHISQLRNFSRRLMVLLESSLVRV